MTSFLRRIERRLIVGNSCLLCQCVEYISMQTLEKRVISLECRSPDNSPWHVNYRPVEYEQAMVSCTVIATLAVTACMHESL